MASNKESKILCSGYLCALSDNCERHRMFLSYMSSRAYVRFKPDPNIRFMSPVYNPVTNYCRRQVRKPNESVLTEQISVI